MIPLSISQCDTLPFRFAAGHSTNTHTTCLGVGVNEIENIFDDFSMYPNPVENDITMSFYTEHLQKNQIRIYDIYGKEIYYMKYKSVYGKNNLVINVTNFVRGIYYIGIEDEIGRRLFYKFIKQ
jgi:hypothetical protein